MEKPKVMIKSMDFLIGNKTITLTPDEAKQLKDVLDNLFGKEIIKEYVPVPSQQPTPDPLYPQCPSTPYPNIPGTGATGIWYSTSSVVNFSNGNDSVKFIINTEELDV